VDDSDVPDEANDASWTVHLPCNPQLTKGESQGLISGIEHVDPMYPSEQVHTGVPLSTEQVPNPQFIKSQGLY
jgi:hypothetical protein